jgi:hypothetical protein
LKVEKKPHYRFSFYLNIAPRILITFHLTVGGEQVDWQAKQLSGGMELINKPWTGLGIRRYKRYFVRGKCTRFDKE